MQSTVWYSEDGGPFPGREPFFYDVADFPWVVRIERQWTVIRDELLALLNTSESGMEPYINSEMTTTKGRWKTFCMMFWFHEVEANTARCPRTWALLKTIPHLSAASFNLLEGNATIKPHHGDTNAIVRCHLGLQVPAPAPKCAFRVGSEIRSWEEGKFLLFCDAHEHTAWNNSDSNRYILLIDVIRPDVARFPRLIAARVMASISSAVILQRWTHLRSRALGRVAKRCLFRWLQALNVLKQLAFTF